ncbi:mitochondrial ribosomal protein L27-domain-containing protein [Sphaerosporella brunnea]|uniref:Mitochondrial ribosomal protein L27-domain-containing protein n=1 Tax=Sphaerosporella brunnea TaxID=1250544 RepID=A0A5J5EXL9_9PEZI|nr:mitochondrial ribosomal protein L27-domain-containing protein [Sphaerosporella brunnea]
MQPTTSFLARSTTGIRRLRLTTKMVNGGYYKGTGSGSMGRHTKHGGYKIDWHKVRTYVMPIMAGFDLTPYVTNKMKPTRGRYAEGEHPMHGSVYLRKWKELNGES